VLTLLKTDDSFAPLIARLTFGLVMFPHGAQKALGWFGGYGFSGTMNFFTGQMHIPALFAFLAIAAEFAGSIALIIGFFSRVSAFGIAVVILVATLTVHASNEFYSRSLRRTQPLRPEPLKNTLASVGSLHFRSFAPLE
jgi:putative oxidoreductase